MLIPEYSLWIDAQKYSYSHSRKLYLYAVKLSKNTYFFTYTEMVKYKLLLKKDGYYKAVKGLSKFLKEKYHNEPEVLTELEKIKTLCSKPICNPDVYTPTDDELRKTLEYLQSKHSMYYQFYLGLLYSGVRIRELLEISDNLDKYKVLQYEHFKKIVINSTRYTKKALFIYLPKDYEFPNGVTLGGLSRYLTKHKEIIRPKYLRNYFYKKCIEQGIPAAIADFYKGRSPVSVGNKHYLEKEQLADEMYVKLLQKFSEQTVSNNHSCNEK